MRLRHIEVINAIRITGTLKAAASLLSLSQPAVTQSLQSAERLLGYALFERVRGKLIATREAHLLFPEIAKLDEQMQAVQRLGESLKEGKDGSTLRVLAAPALAQTVVADAAVQFAQNHPGVRLSIRSYYSENATASIALMEADVGILYQSLPHPAIRERVLAQMPLVCVGPPSLLADSETIGIDELQGREIVAPDPSDPLGRLLAKRLAESSIPIEHRFTAQAYHALIALAARAHCLTIVDAASAASAKLQGLRIVPLSPAIAIPVVASVAINGERSALVHAFVESCAQALVSGQTR